jgi:nucleoredoxin
MKSSAGILLLVVVVIAGGVFYLHLRNPEAFARLQTDFVALFSSSSTSDSSSTTTGTTGPNPIAAKMAAPAVNAAARLANTASNVMKAPAVPVVSPEASPAPTVAPSPSPAPAPAQSPAPAPMPAPVAVVAPTPAAAVIPATPNVLPPTQADNSDNSSSASAAASQGAIAGPASVPTWTPPSPLPAKPNWTWTTTDGTVYKNVKIVGIDPANVTILHEDGGTQVPMSKLPPDIQKQLNYDPQAAAGWTIGSLVSGKLVALKNGAMQPMDDSAIRPIKYFAIYYSAQWCPPCHKFTPDLVKFYNGFKPSHPDFELIFISEDHSANLMLAYMKEMAMPWLAVDFGTLVHPGGTFKAPGIEGFANNGIPDLVLVDATGKVLSDSYQNGQYVGPEQVVNDIKTMVQ